MAAIDLDAMTPAAKERLIRVARRMLGELAEDSSGWHKLVAPGYGARGNYGNGAIFISPAQIARWRIR